MKIVTLSIYIFFVLLSVGTVSADAKGETSGSSQLGLPLLVEWEDSPETVLALLRNQCDPIYDKEKGLIEAFILGKIHHFVRFIFDKDGKLSVISDRSFSFGKDNNINHAMKFADRIASFIMECNGTKVYSTREEHKNHIYKFLTPKAFIQMNVETDNKFFNELFKENVGIVHRVYGNPNAKILKK